MTIRTETVGDLTTTPDYWDCECNEEYIWPKHSKECPRCHAEPDEQPDARHNEVVLFWNTPWFKARRKNVAPEAH